MSAVYWIIEYGAIFTEWFLCSIFCGTFIENIDLKKNFWKRLFVTSTLPTLVLICNNVVSLFSPITVIFSTLLFCLNQIIIYNKNPIKASILSVIFVLLISVIDNIIVSTISYGLKIPTSEIYKMSLYRIIAIVCSKTLLMFLTATTNKFFAKKILFPRKYIIILFVSTISMFFLSASIALLDLKNNAVNSYVSIMFFIVMLILLIVIFFGTFKLAEYYENKQQFKLIMLRNQMLEQSMKETEQTFMLWKTGMHDYKHNIINLMSLAENNDMQGIRQYLADESELLGKKLFYYKTGNDTVDTLLNIKQKIAESNGIIFIINAEIPENCKISSADFASLLGNLLDNAIEASEKEEEPFIEVKIKTVKSFMVINVLNKYTRCDTSLQTSKAEKHFHGIGIHSIKQTVKKYGGEFKVEITDNTFNVKIMIPM